MLFRLALALGKTVTELRACLPHAEFVEWCAFYSIEPFGEWRADLRAGIVAATVRNGYAPWVNPEFPAKPIDFMPFLDAPASAPAAEPAAPEQELTDEELAAWADAAVYGIPPGASNE